MPRIVRSLTIVSFVFGLIAGVLLVTATAALAVSFETERLFPESASRNDPRMQFGLQAAPTEATGADTGYRLWGQEEMNVGPFRFDEVEVRDGRLNLRW